MHRSILFLLLLGACTAAEYTSSSFPDTLELQPQADGTSIWTSDTFLEYDRILVEPFVVYFHPNVQFTAVDPNELDLLLMQMRGSAIEALDDDYFLASEPGPGVLLVRVALVNLQEQNVSRLGLESAIVEVRGVGSQNGKLEFAARNEQALRGLDVTGSGANRWAAARELAAKGAQWVKAQIDRAAGAE